MNPSEPEVNRCRQRQARENACEQVTVFILLLIYWMRKWRKIFQPITKRSDVTDQSNHEITFDTESIQRAGLHRAKQNEEFGEKVQDYKDVDYSSSNLISRGDPQLKAAILGGL